MGFYKLLHKTRGAAGLVSTSMLWEGDVPPGSMETEALMFGTPLDLARRPLHLADGTLCNKP